MKRFINWIAVQAGKTETKLDDKAVSEGRKLYNDLKFIGKKTAAVLFVFGSGLIVGAVIF